MPYIRQGNGATAASPGGWRRRAAARGPQTPPLRGCLDDPRAMRRGIADLAGPLGQLAALHRSGPRVERLELHRCDPLAPSLRLLEGFDALPSHRSKHQDNVAFVLDAQHELRAPALVEREQRDDNAAESDRLQFHAPRRDDAPMPSLPRQRWLGWGSRQRSCHGPSGGHTF